MGWWTDEDEVREQLSLWSVSAILFAGRQSTRLNRARARARASKSEFLICPLVHLFNDTIDLETDRVHDEVGLVDHYQRNLQ